MGILSSKFFEQKQSPQTSSKKPLLSAALILTLFSSASAAGASAEIRQEEDFPTRSDLSLSLPCRAGGCSCYIAGDHVVDTLTHGAETTMCQGYKVYVSRPATTSMGRYLGGTSLAHPVQECEHRICPESCKRCPAQKSRLCDTCAN